MQATRSFIEILADELRKEIRAEFEAEYGQQSPVAGHITSQAIAKADQVQLWLNLRMGGAIAVPARSMKAYGVRGAKGSAPQSSVRQLTMSVGKERIGQAATIEQIFALEFFNREGSSLNPTFTESDLKSEFRKIAMQIHPDRHPSATAAEIKDYSCRFQTLVESAEVLEATLK